MIGTSIMKVKNALDLGQVIRELITGNTYCHYPIMMNILRNFLVPSRDMRGTPLMHINYLLQAPSICKLKKNTR